MINILTCRFNRYGQGTSGKYFYLNQADSLNKLRFCFAVSNLKINLAISQLRNYFPKQNTRKSGRLPASGCLQEKI